MQVFISGFANMYSNLMTNSNWRHNADPNKANNGTDNGRAKRHIFTKKGKAIQLYVERFSNVFARCGKIPGRTYINFKLL